MRHANGTGVPKRGDSETLQTSLAHHFKDTKSEVVYELEGRTWIKNREWSERLKAGKIGCIYDEDIQTHGTVTPTLWPLHSDPDATAFPSHVGGASH